LQVASQVQSLLYWSLTSKVKKQICLFT